MKISEIAELMVATGTLFTGTASVIIAKKSQKNASHAKQSGSNKALVGWGESPNLPRLYHIRQKNEIFTYFHIRIFYISNNFKRQIKVKESG